MTGKTVLCLAFSHRLRSTAMPSQCFGKIEKNHCEVQKFLHRVQELPKGRTREYHFLLL